MYLISTLTVDTLLRWVIIKVAKRGITADAGLARTLHLLAQTMTVKACLGDAAANLFEVEMRRFSKLPWRDFFVSQVYIASILLKIL